MDKKIYYLTDTNRKHIFTEMYNMLPVGWKIKVSPPGRTLDQNALLWSLLHDVSAQVDWYGLKLSPDEWKDVFTASLKRHKVVPAIDGQGFVVCGLHTSRLSKADFSDLLELIIAFGAQKNVQWGFESKQVIEAEEVRRIEARSKVRITK